MQKNAAIFAVLRCGVFCCQTSGKAASSKFFGLILLHSMILLSKAYGLTFSPVLKSMISAGS